MLKSWFERSAAAHRKRGKGSPDKAVGAPHSTDLTSVHPTTLLGNTALELDTQPPFDSGFSPFDAWAKRFNIPRLKPLAMALRERVEEALPTAEIELRRFAGPLSHVGPLEHLRVAHLTDLHVGRVTPLEVQHQAVAMTNAESPDLVVITGDFVCHSQLYLDQLIEVISAIKSPVMAVLGNHDHWSGSNEVRWALKKAGAEVLDNATTVITLRGQRLQVVGLDDAYTSHADPHRALKGLDRTLPTLGLSHIAEEADNLWSHGVPLVLSGHTHGGQVTWARLHELAIGRLAGHRYIHGLYGSRGSDVSQPLHAGAVYVGAGIGSAVMPLRIGERARRELTIFELGHAPGVLDEHHSEQQPLPGRKPSERTKARRARAVATKRSKREKRGKS